MQPYTACLQISRLKILVCGEKGVGKTSLIHAFRDDRFTENVQETGEMVCRMHYIHDRRILFQMVELHIGKLLPVNAHNAKAIMLLYDDESTPTLKRMREYWYSKINLYFSHVPLFLVRSKCDLKTSGVNYVFFEILSALSAKPDTESTGVDFNLSMSTMETASAVFSKLGSSGPLLKQIVINARECISNPAAFPDIKGSIDSYLPYSIFGSAPHTKQNSTPKEEKQSIQKDESRDQGKTMPNEEELTETTKNANAKPFENLRKNDKGIAKEETEAKSEPNKKPSRRLGEAAQGNDEEYEEEA